MNYLETLPLSGIARYTGAAPRDGVPFSGYPRQHPTDKTRLLLINDPLGQKPLALEFRLDDVLFAAEEPSAVTESGEAAPLVKLWVRKGAHGMIMEPFEVNDECPLRFGTGGK